MEYYPAIYTGKAKHGDYMTYKARLESFEDVDDIDFHKRLAKCGFHSTGIPGYIRCFYCGGCFRDLPSDENIWVHHAADFPECDFLKLHKGEKFVEKVLAMNKSDSMEIDEDDVQECIDSDQMIEDLNSRASLMLMDRGYKQADVEQAIIKSREKYGNVEFTSSKILECLLENESIETPSTIYSTAPSTSTYKESPAKAFADFSKMMYTTQEGLNKEHRELLEENRQMRSSRLCKICLDREACMLFIPCGHLISCPSCASKLKTCAVCRTEITEVKRIFSG